MTKRNSKKAYKKYDKSAVNLGKELYNILNKNIEIETKKLNKLLEKLQTFKEVPENVQNVIKDEIKYIEKMRIEINKMKQNSIALINQITIISKQRVYDDIIFVCQMIAWI